MKVVPPNLQNGPDQSVPAHPVSGLAVCIENHRPVLVLEVAYQGPETARGGRDSKIRLALSPPAAMQLSRLLRRSVKSYLRSQPDQENQT